MREDFHGSVWSRTGHLGRGWLGRRTMLAFVDAFKKSRAELLRSGSDQGEWIQPMNETRYSLISSQVTLRISTGGEWREWRRARRGLAVRAPRAAQTWRASSRFLGRLPLGSCSIPSALPPFSSFPSQTPPRRPTPAAPLVRVSAFFSNPTARAGGINSPDSSLLLSQPLPQKMASQPQQEEASSVPQAQKQCRSALLDDPPGGPPPLNHLHHNQSHLLLAWGAFLKSIASFSGDLSSLTAPPFILSPVSLSEFPSYWGESCVAFPSSLRSTAGARADDGAPHEQVRAIRSDCRWGQRDGEAA